MVSVCRAAAAQLVLHGELQIPEHIPDHLLHQLEILACDSVTLQFRPSEVALALLAAEFQTRNAEM
ncbi:Cyclin-G2, partial [Caligus rogercresseyi]